MQEKEVPELNIFPKRFLCKGLRQSCRSPSTQSGRDFGSVLTGVKRSTQSGRHGSRLRQGQHRNGHRTAQDGGRVQIHAGRPKDATDDEC